MTLFDLQNENTSTIEAQRAALARFAADADTAELKALFDALGNELFGRD